MLHEANMGNSKAKRDACFRGEGVYISSGVKEMRQESEINTIVWVFQLLLAGIVLGSGDGLTVLLCILASSIMVFLGLNK